MKGDTRTTQHRFFWGKSLQHITAADSPERKTKR